MVQATVHIVNSDSAQFEEVELLLRRSLSAHSATGYEINFSVKPGNPYTQIVRWNGALGDWTLLNATGIGVNDGDVVSVAIVNNLITAYINGTNVLQATDGTYTTGSPGMGFYLQTGSSNFDSDFGFTSFMATDGSVPEPMVPTVPTNLVAVAVSPSQINLSWAASTDNVGVVGYRIYRNGVLIGTTNATSYSDIGLIANTSYAYTVAAFDAAGNLSAQSAVASTTTPSSSDTTLLRRLPIFNLQMCLPVPRQSPGPLQQIMWVLQAIGFIGTALKSQPRPAQPIRTPGWHREQPTHTTWPPLMRREMFPPNPRNWW